MFIEFHKMGISWFLILCILLTTFEPIQSTSRGKPPKPPSDLIQKTCKNTKYYELCVSTLKSDSSSAKADTKGLALIMVKAAVANATSTNSLLSSLMLSSTNDTLAKKVMKDCADKYAAANDALQSSIQDLAMEMYDYASLDVMAAADYPNACHNEFKMSPLLRYPPELALGEEQLTRICNVILGIIGLLG